MQKLQIKNGLLLGIQSGRIGADEEIDDTKDKTVEEIEEMIEQREFKAGAQILEMVRCRDYKAMRRSKDRGKFVRLFIRKYREMQGLQSYKAMRRSKDLGNFVC